MSDEVYTGPTDHLNYSSKDAYLKLRELFSSLPTGEEQLAVILALLEQMEDREEIPPGSAEPTSTSIIKIFAGPSQ